MKPKVVIMDLGGTIINNKEIDFLKGLSYIYDTYCKHDIPKETLLKDANLIWELAYQKRDHDNFELNFHNYLNYIKETIGFKENYDYDILENEFIEHAVKDEIIDGVVELLSYFQANKIDVYILSNSCFTSQNLNHELKMLNLDKYFKRIFSSAEYLMRKPSPLFFNVAIKYIKRIYKDLANDDIWYIGNEYKYDIEGSNYYNVKSIWLNIYAKKVDNNKAWMEINNYQTLLSYLKKEEKDETI